MDWCLRVHQVQEVTFVVDQSMSLPRALCPSGGSAIRTRLVVLGLVVPPVTVLVLPLDPDLHGVLSK